MAAGNTYVPIATQTLGSAAASVTFSSISSAYTDLVLVLNSTTVLDSYAYVMQFNGDSSSIYSDTLLVGSSSATSGRHSNTTWLQIGNNSSISTGGIYDIAIANIMNYSNNTTYKTVISRYGVGDDRTSTTVGMWRSTAVISSLTISCAGSNVAAGSTFSLYGILAA